MNINDYTCRHFAFMEIIVHGYGEISNLLVVYIGIFRRKAEEYRALEDATLSDITQSSFSLILSRGEEISRILNEILNENRLLI